jgi:hypothetical protein
LGGSGSGGGPRRQQRKVSAALTCLNLIAALSPAGPAPTTSRSKCIDSLACVTEATTSSSVLLAKPLSNPSSNRAPAVAFPPAIQGVRDRQARSMVPPSRPCPAGLFYWQGCAVVSEGSMTQSTPVQFKSLQKAMHSITILIHRCRQLTAAASQRPHSHLR